MRVHFQGFWAGIMDRTDPVNVSFFLDFFSQVFNCSIEVGTPETSDILVESVWVRTNTPSLIGMKRWLFTFFYTGESFFSFLGFPTVPFEAYTALLGYKDTHLNFIKLPLFILYNTLYPNMMNPVTEIPKYSVSTVITNSRGEFRNKFLDSLGKVFPVSYGGEYRNNIGGKIGGTHAGDELIRFYRNFKFVVSMENSQEEYYITEKLYNAMRAGIVPVYWGSPNVTKYFNPNRFLHVRSEYDIQAVIQRMLTMKDEEYLSMVQQPIFVEGVNGYADAVRDTKSLIATVSQV